MTFSTTLRYYAEFLVLLIVMLSVLVLNVIILSVIVLNVIMLSVIAPQCNGLFTLAMITASSKAKMSMTVSKLVLSLAPWAKQQIGWFILVIVVLPKEPRQVQVQTPSLFFCLEWCCNHRQCKQTFTVDHFWGNLCSLFLLVLVYNYFHFTLQIFDTKVYKIHCCYQLCIVICLSVWCCQSVLP